MAKRVIKINKGGIAAQENIPSSLGIKGPMRPVRLGKEAAGHDDLKRTQPMKRMVVASASQQRRQSIAAPAPASGSKQTPQRKKKSSGPPLWLIPVGIIGLVVLIMIIVSASSSSRQDPYYQDNTGQYKERQAYIPKTGPQPMKEWMDKNGGESEMAKARKARMTHRPTTTATSNKGQ